MSVAVQWNLFVFHALQPDLNLSVQAVIRGRNILHRYVHVEVPAALLDCKRTFGVEKASQGFFSV